MNKDIQGLRQKLLSELERCANRKNAWQWLISFCRTFGIQVRLDKGGNLFSQTVFTSPAIASKRLFFFFFAELECRISPRQDFLFCQNFNLLSASISFSATFPAFISKYMASFKLSFFMRHTAKFFRVRCFPCFQSVRGPRTWQWATAYFACVTYVQLNLARLKKSYCKDLRWL